MTLTQGFVRGSSETSWSSFSSFDSSCSLTLWSTREGILGSVIAEKLACELSRLTKVGKLKGVNKRAHLPLLEAPLPEGDAQTEVAKRQQKLKEAIEKLRHSSSECGYRYMDLARKAFKVHVAIPQISPKSELISISPKGKVGTLCLPEALG